MPLSSITILAVDDEPNNLRALRLDLEDAGYNVLTAENGESAWSMLHEHLPDIKTIVLDRMMPGMDGIQFTLRAKSTAATANLPIVMQTAAAERNQVIEGIEAGVYYYLTKPYDKDVMISIVRAAVDECERYIALRNELRQFKSKLHLVRNSHFEVRTLEDAHYLATFVSQFFPEPERTVLGLYELLVNGIEHGNLGMSYADKTALINTGEWTKEIARLQALPENRHKKVDVFYERGDSEIRLIIRDEGEGFEWQPFLEITPERATHNHGRGIALSRMMSFDSMQYQGSGNTVVCSVRVPPEQA